MQRLNPADSMRVDNVSARRNLLTGQIIGCALDVHRELGPGLFEKAYERALCVALSARRVQFLRQVPCPVSYRGQIVGTSRCDLLVENLVVVEVKSIERLERLHVAQVLTYLRATGTSLGLIINFKVTKLRDGIKRVIRS
ncbi:MAG TPA: GxxExxY protein [Vicinamibacterales bacterium]